MAGNEVYDDNSYYYEEDDDITLPFALYVIAHLRSLSRNAKTAEEKLEAMRRCQAAFLVMTAGSLSRGVQILTTYVLGEFEPFTDGRLVADSNWMDLDRFPITDTVAAEGNPVPPDCLDLFVTGEAALVLAKELEAYGFRSLEEDDDWMAIVDREEKVDHA
jgi:hypothetical protein